MYSKVRNLLLCFILCVTPVLCGCADFRPGWISEESYSVESVEGPLGGHFEDDEWIPDNPDIAMTYKIPDISSGFLFDVRELKLTPTIQVELLEFNAPWKYFSTFKVDFGVGYQRAYGYLGVLVTSIFEVSVGISAGWNWETNDYFYGPSFTIIKF